MFCQGKDDAQDILAGRANRRRGNLSPRPHVNVLSGICYFGPREIGDMMSPQSGRQTAGPGRILCRMQRLWAPWRMSYVQQTDAPPVEGCIFCVLPEQGPEHFARNLILCCTTSVFVMMNRYPYSGGHLLVAPRLHGADLMALPTQQYQQTCEMVRVAQHLVCQTLQAHGANLGMNCGRVAGAGIDQHSHFHIVPRWNGDTNFMPVLADVKVISEDLAATYAKLRPVFAHLDAL